MRTIEGLGSVLRSVSKDSIIVSGLGRANYGSLSLCANRPLMTDSMGDVIPLSVGLAMGLERGTGTGRVDIVAVLGDGSFLFSMESLSTLAQCSRFIPSLVVVILDNGLYESGGGLSSRSFNLNWPSLFEAFELPYAEFAHDNGIGDYLRHRPHPVTCVRLIVKDYESMPDYDGHWNGRETTTLFRKMLLDDFGVRPSRPGRKY
jgi:thiamine pyrophosphate-dependent acetolactate synthase large subunit-like protein